MSDIIKSISGSAGNLRGCSFFGSEISMRVEEFKMERENLVKKGDVVRITEGELPSSWYYTIVPAVAMSRNYKFSERIRSKEGIVEEIVQTERGYFVKVKFDE